MYIEGKVKKNTVSLITKRKISIVAQQFSCFKPLPNTCPRSIIKEEKTRNEKADQRSE